MLNETLNDSLLIDTLIDCFPIVLALLLFSLALKACGDERTDDESSVDAAMAQVRYELFARAVADDVPTRPLRVQFREFNKRAQMSAVELEQALRRGEQNVKERALKVRPRHRQRG